MKANSSPDNRADDDRLRLDKWLWAARFYKTRALATEAINGGHVQLNGQRIKPSRGVQVGDQLLVRKESVAYDIEVLGLSAKRGPASVAQQLYRESAASIAARAAYAEQRRLCAAEAPNPGHRPDKRARRHIIRFNSQQG